MSWSWGALMPHPPILIPEVGCGREQEAVITLNGSKQLAQRVSEKKPEYLLLMSPHQPYAPGALFINEAENLSGSLEPFGAPSVALHLQSPSNKLQELTNHLAGNNFPIRIGQAPNLTRDHGSLVPLYWLRQVWKKLPPVILVSPMGLTPIEAFKLGQLLASFDDGIPWGFLASGDLSHRLTPNAPAGYHPSGKIFDEIVLASLEASNPRPLIELSSDELESAGECGLRSVITLMGLSQALGKSIKLISYEGPFGVGYCNALLLNAKTHPYARLARRTVERLLHNQPIPLSGIEVDSDESLWSAPRACFVSIKTKRGDLRGCIGTILPAQISLDQEIIANAISASTRDPRFNPMTAAELNNVLFSVDVLSLPEPITDIKMLDPAIWGVIVSKNGRRGLLLPDLDGVDTAEQQLDIAAQKGGIMNLNGAVIERFRVDRYKETEG